MREKVTHDDLIKLAQFLKFSNISDEGMCKGFSAMLAQGILSEEDEKSLLSKSFFNRLAFIAYYKEFYSIKKLSEKIEAAPQLPKYPPVYEKDKQQLLDVKIFFTGVEMYLNPDLHRDVFGNRFITQENLPAIYKLVRSNKLKDENSKLEILLVKPYSFDEAILIRYLKDLADVLSQTNLRLPILFECGDHSVCARFSKHDKIWLYVDLADFELKPDNESDEEYIEKSDEELYVRKLNHAELDKSLFKSFNFTKEKPKYSVFTTTVLANNTKETSLEISQLKESFKAFDAKYPIKPEHAVMYDTSHIGLLHLACQQGHLEVVVDLLKQGNINVNLPDNEGYTPLHYACQQGYLAIVGELLKQKNININQLDNKGRSPLFIVCIVGHANIAKKLLNQENIDVNQITTGYTPLHIACEDGHPKIVELLLQSQKVKAIDAIGIDNQTPLQTACLSPDTRKKSRLFNLLLENGASLMHRDKNGQRAMDLALQQKNNAAIGEILKFAQHNQFKLTNIMSSESFTKLKNWSAKRKLSDEVVSYLQEAYAEHKEAKKRGTFFSPPIEKKEKEEEVSSSLKLQ